MITQINYQIFNPRLPNFCGQGCNRFLEIRVIII